MTFWRVVLVALLMPLFSAFSATLSVTFNTVPQNSEVNLTSEGKLDWVHWGLFTDTSLNRKSGVTPFITDFILQDASNGYAYVYQYADNFNGYTWSDGFPEIGATNTPTGVWAYGVPNIGSGFRFAVPADTIPRTLKVYVGWFAGMGQFEAHLSDNSAPGYINSTPLLEPHLAGGPGHVYTIDYAADSPGQSLIIRWTLISLRSSTANVTLQAAALSASEANNPPFAVITNEANGNFTTGTPIRLGADAFDSDGQVERVEFYDLGTRLGEAASSPFTFDWNGASPGRHIVTAHAIDNQGASRESPPVDLFVHGNGGLLTGALGFPPTSVNLTVEGTGDWIHGGLINSNSVNRKAGVAPQVNIDVLGTQPAKRFSNNYTSFTWTDGAPVTTESGTPTGVYVTGFTNGFKITAPADTTPRRLKLYAGLYGSAENLQAFLSDASAPAWSDTSLDDIYANRYAAYTIDYSAASPGQTLTVLYRLSRAYDMDFGNVTLPAVTLEGPAVMLVRILNPRSIANSLVFNFNTEAARTYTVQYTTELTSGAWHPLTTIAGDGNVATVSDPMTTGSRFYRVRVP
jgi:hypothetical protein